MKPNSIGMPYLAMALGMAAMSGMAPGRPHRKQKEAKRCLLPGCRQWTTHNGGYCCPEHCKEHRAKK